MIMIACLSVFLSKEKKSLRIIMDIDANVVISRWSHQCEMGLLFIWLSSRLPEFSLFCMLPLEPDDTFSTLNMG